MAEEIGILSNLELDAGGYIDEAEGAADATDEVGGAADDTADALFDLEPAGFAASGALAGVGGAMQGALSSSQDWRESLGRTSVSMGLSQGATEDLAASISDATFPMDDAVGTMDSLARQGIDTEEDMERVAGAMDAVADATGTTAESVADTMGPALAAFGEDLEDADEHMDTFTFVARNTTQDVEDFGGAIEKLAPELQEMDVSLEDSAAVMAALEDQGITGRQAIQEFRTATNEADGDQAAFLESLGLSEEELEGYNEQLENSEGITEEYADAANESVTTMDELGAIFDDVKLAAGGMLGPVDAVAPAMMTLGGAGMFMSTVNMSAVIPSVIGVTAAMGPLLVPILAVAAAVGALAIAHERGWIDITDWVEWGTDVVGDALSWLVDTVEWAIDTASFILFEWNPLEPVDEALDDVRGAFGDARDAVTDTIDDAIDTVQDTFMRWHPLGILWSHRDDIAGAFGDIRDDATDRVRSAIGTVQDTLRRWHPLGILWDHRDDVMDFFGGWRSDITGWASNTVDDIVDRFTGLGESITSPVRDTWNVAIGGTGFDLPGFDISIPSWVPEIGGRGFAWDGVSVRIPRLETGGRIDAGGLAALDPGERVLPAAQVSDRGEASFDPATIAEGMRRADRTDDLIRVLRRILGAVEALERGGGGGDVGMTHIERPPS